MKAGISPLIIGHSHPRIPGCFRRLGAARTEDFFAGFLEVNYVKYREVFFDESKGFPAGEGLYYECLLCGSRRSTFDVKDAGFCECRNLHVDVDYCRISVKTPGSVKLIETYD